MNDDALVQPSEVGRWLEELPQPVAVTGGTGFVGSHLVDTLCAAGMRPRVLVRDRATPRWISARDVVWIEGSLEDTDAVARLVEGSGTVIHLAGVVTADSAAVFDRANGQGTAGLVELVRGHAPGARLVYVSSLAAVGPSSGPDGVSPDARPSPVSHYGRSKLAGERAVSALDAEGWWTVVRPPAIYGPRDTDMFELFKIARSGVAAVPWGDRWMTVAHVADVVRGVVAAAVGPGRRIYHLGEPTPYRVDELMRRLGAAAGRRVRVVRVPPATVIGLSAAAIALRKLGLWNTALTRDKAREAMQHYWTSSTADSLSMLGLGDFIDLDTGAVSTWEWYRANGWVG